MDVLEQIPLVAIDGAACGGKSSFLKRAPEALLPHGWSVSIAEESARRLIKQGMQIKHAIAAGDWERVIGHQEEILTAMIENENRMLRCAKRDGHPKPVVLCDRGVAGIPAFLPRNREGYDHYIAMLDKVGLNPLSALDRYAGVIDLVTAAFGAGAHYVQDDERDEDLETARMLELWTQEAWLGHQHQYIIDNSTDFSGKLRRAEEALLHILGIPESLEIERKYLLSGVPDFSNFPVPYRAVHIEQHYLYSAG